jgi:hypothetical protein
MVVNLLSNFYGFAKSRESLKNVSPAKAGIQQIQLLLDAGSSPA